MITALIIAAIFAPAGYGVWLDVQVYQKRKAEVDRAWADTEALSG